MPVVTSVPSQAAPSPASVRSILVIQTAGIGDALLTTGAVRALAGHYPGATIDTLSREFSSEVFEHHPDVRNTHVLRSGVRSTIGMVRLMRREKYDLVIDFHGKPRTAWMVRLSGVRHRFGHGRERVGSRARLYTVHGIEGNGFSGAGRLEMLRSLGIEHGDPTPVFNLDEEPKAQAAAFFKSVGIGPGERVFAISPASAFSSKTWPAERWVETVRELGRRHGARIVAVAPPNDTQGVAAMEARSGGMLAVSPPASLAYQAAIFARAEFMLGDCSGPRHLATSQGVPTLTIHGATDPGNWTHPLDQYRTVQQPMECRPCHRLVCPLGTTACLVDLEVETVLAAADELLQAHGGGRR